MYVSSVTDSMRSEYTICIPDIDNCLLPSVESFYMLMSDTQVPAIRKIAVYFFHIMVQLNI